MLLKISQVLNHDFFQYYQQQAIYTQSDDKSQLITLQHEITGLQDELADAQKEIEYLKNIVTLRQEEMRLLESKLKTQKELSDAIINNLKTKEQNYIARLQLITNK
ncbi:MAG: hypothetical protein EOO43_01950 [Flavobacterium sp.]|nr:MAG: hypothetical protein EOO43_01950 [Flavobacterium sp.]